MGSYEVSGRVTIPAAIGDVYRVATDPSLVPRYAEEIAGITKLDDGDPTAPLVCVRMRLLGTEREYRYRYYYDPPRAYGGVDADQRMLRGYFHFDFVDVGGATEVRHREGVVSRTPLIAEAVGRLYFRAIQRGGSRKELERLQLLVMAEVAAGQGRAS
jgi:hypothetical protein